MFGFFASRTLASGIYIRDVGPVLTRNRCYLTNIYQDNLCSHGGPLPARSKSTASIDHMCCSGHYQWMTGWAID